MLKSGILSPISKDSDQSPTETAPLKSDQWQILADSNSILSELKTLAQSVDGLLKEGKNPLAARSIEDAIVVYEIILRSYRDGKIDYTGNDETLPNITGITRRIDRIIRIFDSTELPMHRPVTVYYQTHHEELFPEMAESSLIRELIAAHRNAVKNLTIARLASQTSTTESAIAHRA